jgi:RNA 2',3'-cyclic 3'-phosphodiesterase
MKSQPLRRGTAGDRWSKDWFAMASSIRAFIGIPVRATPALREVLRQLGRFGRPLRATPEENLHLTLKFLGDIAPAQVDPIAEAVRSVAGGAAVHEIELVGLGAFPTVARPSVVWAGIRPDDRLKAMAAELDRLLRPLGFLPEARGFHAHLTLGRVKGPAPGLGEMLEQSRDGVFGKAILSTLGLYQSEPTATGSRYTALATAMLATQ